MLFCPKCGAILMQKAKTSGCPRCNYTSKEKDNMKITEKIEIILNLKTSGLPMQHNRC